MPTYETKMSKLIQKEYKNGESGLMGIMQANVF